MISKSETAYTIARTDSHWIINYSAMAGPCEILVRCQSESEADRLASLAFTETRRIERKFSRYRDDNIIHAINNSDGEAVRTDPELARLLDYADECYRLSDGLFDITSGVLRRAWTFKGSEVTPDRDLIDSLKQQVGWDKVRWKDGLIHLRPGMEIDLGGIGKEYAVDVVADLLFRESDVPLMVNFGGDIRAVTSAKNPTPWVVGIEDPEHENRAVGQIELTNGGVATSGDLRRFCFVDGVRLGHILNPKTGWPVEGAPRSVTALGHFCVEAGLLATLAMLHGSDAESFLEEQKAQFHCIR